MIRLDSPTPKYTRSRSMHRIHWSTVVTLALGVVLTLVVALQLLPVAAVADDRARAVTQSSSFADTAALPLPLFVVGAMLAVLLTAASLWSAAVRSGDRAHLLAD